MLQSASDSIQKFRDAIGVKFQLYNSLFLSLPFYGIDKTGILLSLFNSHCEESFAENKSPAEIINDFFARHTSINTEAEKADLLFRFVQYTERQVVLFDALEDAAFAEINDLQGTGTIKQLESAVLQRGKETDLLKKLNDFSVRLVLTAHPTQFYPGSVLGIINDLVDAISANNVSLINTYLQQLGRTPFFKKQKPTPFDEAQSLIWYLENVFYSAVGNLVSDLKKNFPNQAAKLDDLVEMGFWSGGDRDGNPFVTVDTTLRVADALKRSILKCYYQDVRKLKRRLTFTEVDIELANLEKRLYENAFQNDSENLLTKAEIAGSLKQIRTTLLEKHDGLFVHLVNNLIDKVEIFGVHFASLDIRQESEAHRKIIEHIAENSDALPENYADLSDDEKIKALLNVRQMADLEKLTDELAKDTLKNTKAVRQIQQNNGEKGCERYIISQCQTALNAIEVYGLFLLGGWQADELNVDIVPLFETIGDLQRAASVMKTLYETPEYREHLKRRNETQTIMLGFSDGTKDGGYLMANWSIYKAKDELTWLSRKYGINVIFFDGRGGPPARGGGKTHKFYSSMGKNIAHDSIQLTVQGQTVSSNFGTIDAARYNIEQLLHAGIYNHLFAPKAETLSDAEKILLEKLANESFAAYQDLKNHPLFLDYLSDVSPLRFYAETNIGSRPAKRGAGKLTLKDLRAIPFVGAWSQLKQNVPGFYGVGSAVKALERQGKLNEIKRMYRENAFFKALIDNSEMAMQKCFFPLTQHLAEHQIYGEIWRKIYDEFELSRRMLGIISGKENLMSDFPNEQQSVRMREKIVIPLTTIQQFALAKISEKSDLKSTYEKLVMRCSFGIINAGRNSA
jgi:phosphoenolpyruvate carboxylase